MLENFSNNAKTTLAANLTNNATSLSVLSSNNFPTTGQFRIKIDNELLLVTNISGNTFTVVRGIEGTTAVLHIQNSLVQLSLTADGLKNYISDSCGEVVAFGDLPTESSNTSNYNVLNGFFQYRGNGSSYQAFGPIYGPFETPKITDFPTWNNQSTSSILEENGVVCFTNPGGQGSSENVNSRLKSISGDFEFKLVFSMLKFPSTSFFVGGISIFDEVTGKIRIFVYRDNRDSNTQLAIYDFNNATSINGITYSANVRIQYPCMLKIKKISNSVIFSFSNDFKNWLDVETISLSSGFIQNISHIGYCINNYNSDANQKSGVYIYHAKVT